MNTYDRIIYLLEGAIKAANKAKLSLDEGGERQAYRRLKSKDPNVKQKGVKGVFRAWASRSARHPDITPDDIKKGYASGDAHPVERDKALDAAVVISRGRMLRPAPPKSRKK